MERIQNFKHTHTKKKKKRKGEPDLTFALKELLPH